MENNTLSNDNNGICARKIKWLKRSVPALILTGITFLAVFLCFDILYDINDDVMIESMLSGSYLKQYPFTYYLSAELGIVISMMYSLVPGVAWLGVTFAGFYVLSFFLMANKIYERLMDRKVYIRMAALVLLEVVFVCVLLSNMVLIHYTVVAAVLGAAGLLLFVFAKKPSEFIAPIIMFLLCYMVRVNVFFMLVPFAGIVFIYLLLNNQDVKAKSYWAGAGYFLVAVVVVVIINTIIPLKFSEEWKTYVEYNDKRTSVYDYTGIPDYNDAKGFYNLKTDMDENDVALYQSYDIALRDRMQSYSDLLLIEHYAVSLNHESLISKVKWCTYIYLYRFIREKTDNPFNMIVIILYVMALAQCIAMKNYRNIVIVMLMGLYRSALWIYLMYQGRYPERVTLSIYIMEIMMLLAIILRSHISYNSKAALDSSNANNSENSSKLSNEKLMLVILGLLTLVFAVPIKFQMQELSENYQAKINTNNTDDVVYSYIDAHQENVYLIDVYATVERTKKALVKGVDKENYLLLGGWPVGHPLYLDKLKSLGGDNALEAFKKNDNMYIVIRQDEGADIDLMNTFTGCDLQVVDYIPSGNTGFYILGK